MSTTKFISLRDAVTKKITTLLADNTALYVSVQRDELWDAYLAAFAEEDRQYHTCNTCKSFIRNFAHVGVIIGKKFHSVMDVDAPAHYKPSIGAMLAIIKRRQIAGIYSTKEWSYGKKRNTVLASELINWDHFFVDIPASIRNSNPATIQGKYNDAHNTLKRAYEEITPESIETALELIEENLIPRGNQVKALLEAFGRDQRNYVKAKNKNIFLWSILIKELNTSRIRNSMIGTFLVDLSEGKDVDNALRAVEAKEVGYKRPKALVTKRQIETMKATLLEAGLLPSLSRVFAPSVPVNNTLYVHRTGHTELDVFDEMISKTTTDPNSLKSVPEITAQQFLDILPNISDIEMYLGNNHDSNFVSLITAADPESPLLFPWTNPFSWTYANDMASSKIKERVKAAGGGVDGVVRVSLAWHNADDLDLHVVEPNKNRIFHGSKRSSTGGVLDVDMNAGYRTNKINPVENINWTSASKILKGEYKVMVKNYTLRTRNTPGFTVEIECNGELFTYTFPTSPAHGQTQTIISFDYNPATGITIKGKTGVSQSKEFWGVNTNKFYQVDTILNSPNYWDESIGNKHLIFINKSFINDESPRGFFNEQIKPELVRNHKRGLEVLGGKMKVPHSKDQLSGLGFPDTQRNHIILRYRNNGNLLTSKVNF